MQNFRADQDTVSGLTPDSHRFLVIFRSCPEQETEHGILGALRGLHFTKNFPQSFVEFPYNF